MWWNDTLDLGATDYLDEDEYGVDRFLAPQQPRAYQPFRPPQQSIDPDADRYDQVLQSEQRRPHSRYTSPLDELDAYEGMQTRQGYADDDYGVADKSAKLWEGRYDDFVKTKLKPFHEQLGLVDLAETDDDYFDQIDAAHKKSLLQSQESDGFFGESKEKERAKERLKMFGDWGGSHGLGAQFKSFRDEALSRRKMADGAEALNIGMQEAMSAIPVAERIRMEEEISDRKKSPRSKKATNDLLDGLHFDSPNYWNGMLLNPDEIDPRTKLAPTEGFWGGITDSNLRKKLNTRMSAAMKGDIKGVVGRREQVQMDRAARDRGELFSYPNGTMDGVHPVGLSRKDADLLDLERMRKEGMTEFKGKPLEEMMEQLGGRERLKMARVMETVYNTKNNWQQSQLDFIKSAGSSKSIKLAKRMRAAERTKDNAIKLAAKYGLDNELFQQAESVGWLQGIGNAISRGFLMHEQSRYGLDFLTNTLDQDEMQRLIDINQEMTDLPSSTFFERYKKADKATGMGDALWKLLGEPMVWPEMFVESMSALLPTAFMVGIPAMAAGGAMTVASRGKLPGALGAVSPAKQALYSLSNFRRGGQLGAAVGSGVSSALLEGSGMVLEALQELNINIKDPKVFAAAWNNESIRRKVVDSGIKKGVPIGIMDGISASFAGRVAGLGMHTRNALWKGGKLIDPKAFEQAVRDVPRFTKFSRATSVGAELGFDVASGMGGEYLGQLWEKDAGEDFDYDAIAAEGVIGFGPGAIGGIVEWNRNRPANVSFEDTTLDYTDMQMGPDGSTFRVTRAGWTEMGFTRKTSDGMTSELLSRSPQIKSADDPKAMAVQDFLARMYAANPEKMASLRVVMAKRTPVSGGEQLAGSFEVDQDGNPVMYLNKDQFGENPIPVFMHESGHLARLMVFENVEDLYTLYDTLDPDAKKQAFFDYHSKLGVEYASQSPEVKKKTEAAYRKLGNEKRAEEWFAYQWTSLLAGKAVDKSVKTELKNFLTAHILPFATEYTASDTETLAGGSKATTIKVQQDILRWMGHTPYGTLGSAMLGSLGTPEASLQATGRIADPAMGAYGTDVDFEQEGIRAPAGSLGDWDALNDQDGLNHLIESIKTLFTDQLQLENKLLTPAQELEAKKEYYENIALFLRTLFPNAGILDDLNERSFFTEADLLVMADAAMAEQADIMAAEPREALDPSDTLPERDKKGKKVETPSTDPKVIAKLGDIEKIESRIQTLMDMPDKAPTHLNQIEAWNKKLATAHSELADLEGVGKDWSAPKKPEPEAIKEGGLIDYLGKEDPPPATAELHRMRELDLLLPWAKVSKEKRDGVVSEEKKDGVVSEEKGRWKVTKGYPGYRDDPDTGLTYATEKEAEAAAEKFRAEEFKAIGARTKNLERLKDRVLTPGKFKTDYDKAVKKLKGELAPRGWTATRKYSKKHWVVYEGNTYEAQKDIGVEKDPNTNKRISNVNPEESPDWNLVQDATVTDADIANIPDAAIAAEILGFDKLQEESMFGSAHMGRSLAEGWDESRPGAVGEEALAEELFKYDQDVEGARTALEGRRDELKNDLRRIGVALIGGQMQGPLEVDTKTGKPKDIGTKATLGERARIAMETVFTGAEMENFPAIAGRLTTKKGKGDIVGHDVKAIQKKLKMVNDYLQQLVPEEYGVDWKDEEHVWLEWEVWDLDAVGDKGKQDVIITGEETGQLVMRAPVTLGQLAVSSSIDRVKTDISDYDGHRIQRRLVNTRSPIKNGRKQLAGKQSSGQRVLSEYVARPRTPDATSGTYDEGNQSAPVPESYKTTDPTVGRKKYRAMLDAVRASTLASKIDTLKAKPMGNLRMGKGGKELPQTRDIGGFSADRGTSLAALVLERIGNIREDAARDATKAYKAKKATEKDPQKAREAADDAKHPGTKVHSRFQPPLTEEEKAEQEKAAEPDKTRDPLPFRDLTPTEEAVLFYGGRRGDALSEYYNRPEYFKMNMLTRRHARLQERIREAETKPPSAPDLEKEISAEDKAKYAKGRKRAERAGDVPERSLINLEKRMLAHMMAFDTQIGGYSEKLEEFPSIVSDEGTGRESVNWDKVLENWVWAHTKEKALNQMLSYWESDLAVESIDDDRRRGTRRDEISEHVENIEHARRAALLRKQELSNEEKVAEGKEPYGGKGAWKRKLELPGTPYGEARNYSEIQDAINAKDAEIAAHQARYKSLTGDKGVRLAEEMDELLAERGRAYRYHHPGDPGMDTSEKIPAREGMFKSFTRSKVDEGIDIRPFLAAFMDRPADAKDITAEKALVAFDWEFYLANNPDVAKQFAKERKEALAAAKKAAKTAGKSEEGIEAALSDGLGLSPRSAKQFAKELMGIKTAGKSEEIIEAAVEAAGEEVLSDSVKAREHFLSEGFQDRRPYAPGLFGSNIDLQGDTTAAVTQEDVFDDNRNFKGRYKDDLPRGKENHIGLVIKGEKRFVFWGEAGPTRPEGWRWLNFRELNKSDNLDANEAWIDLKQEEITGSLKNNYLVSAAELANWFLVNRNGKNLVDTLALLPSSEHSGKVGGADQLIQRPGAPGQGLIPLVWDKFIRAMYANLGITAEPNRTEPRVGKDGKPGPPVKPKFVTKAFPQGEVVIKGRKQQSEMISEGGFTEADMANDLIPILQAAIDAGRVDLFDVAEMDKKSDETDLHISMPKDYTPDTEAGPNEKGAKLKPEKEGASTDDAPDDPGGIADEDALATGPVSRETQKKYLSGLKSKEDKKAAWGMLLKIKASPAAKKLKKFLADRIASGNLELRSLMIADEFPLSEGLDGKSKKTSVSGIDNPSIWELFELPPPPEMTPALRKLKANVPGYVSAARVQQIKEWYEDLKKGKFFKQLMFLIEGNVHEILGSQQGKNKSIKEIITEMFTGVIRRFKPAVREPKEEKEDNSRRDFLKSLGFGAVSSVTGLPSAKSVAAVAKATGMSAAQAAKAALLKTMVKSDALRVTAANQARTIINKMRKNQGGLLDKTLSRINSDPREGELIRKRRKAKRLKREDEGGTWTLPDEKSPAKRGDFIEDYVTRTKERYAVEPELKGQYPSEESLRGEAEYAWEHFQVELLEARGLEYFWDEEIYNFHPKVATASYFLWEPEMRDQAQTLLEDQVKQQIHWMERDAHIQAERAAQHKFNLLAAAKGALTLRLTGIQQFDDFEVFEHANRDDVVSSGTEVPNTASSTRDYDGKDGMYEQWVEQEHAADLADSHTGNYLDKIFGVGVGYIWHELYDMTLKKFGYNDEGDMYFDSQQGTGPFKVKNDDLPDTWNEEFGAYIRYPKGFAAAFNSIKITPELVRRAYGKRAGNTLAAMGYASQAASEQGHQTLRALNDQLKKFLAWRKTKKGGGSGKNFEEGLALMQAVQVAIAKLNESPRAIFTIMGSVEDAVNQVEKDLKSLEYLADSTVKKADKTVEGLDAFLQSLPKEQGEKVEALRPKEEEGGRQTLGSGMAGKYESNKTQYLKGSDLSKHEYLPKAKSKHRKLLEKWLKKEKARHAPGTLVIPGGGQVTIPGRDVERATMKLLGDGGYYHGRSSESPSLWALYVDGDFNEGGTTEYHSWRAIVEDALEYDLKKPTPKPGVSQRIDNFNARKKIEKGQPSKANILLGSGAVLTSGMPEFEKLGVLKRLMAGRPSDDPDRKSLIEKLAGADWVQNFVDLSRPVRNLHDKALKDLKIDRNSALWDYYNVHGKIHAYLGKGYYTVERAEREFIDPMIEAFRRHTGITQERWGEYLFVRRAPSFNRHLQLQYEDRMKDTASKYKKGEKEGKKEGEIKPPEDQNPRWLELRQRGARFSGLETDVALARLKEIEADADFVAFLKDKANPLQTFYDMNKDAISQKTDSQLIEGEVDGQGRAEEKRMIAAASYHKWGKNDSIASTEAGTDGVKLTDDYSYAPMQGFEGNDEYLFDREQAFDTLGRAPTATGRAWDQPKQKFMQHGAYGRQKNPEGRDGAWLPAFKAVQGVAQEQYFNDSIRSGKNEVSRSFGALFNMMRAASLKDSKDEYENAKKLVNPDMLQFLDDMSPELQKEIKAEFQDTFEKDFKFEETVEQYVWDDEEVLDENNKAHARLGVEQKVLNTAYRNDPHVFVYREGGIPQFIQFKKNKKGSQMANALKNMQYEPLGAISKRINVGTRFMAKMYTSMNPIFIIPNFFRDFGTAAIHLTEDDKKELFWDTMNINTMRKHAKGIFKAEVMLSKGENPLKNSDITAENAKALLAEAESSGDYSPLYQFAKAAGAKVGYFRHDSVLEQMEDLQKRVNPSSWQSAKEKGGKFFGYVNHMNSAVENSIRMSAFWAAIKKGWTVERAVDVARNITVDFNQKGNFTQQLGAYFVFFGASVNALDRLFRSLREGSLERNLAFTGGLVGASMVTCIFNRLMDDDPEDDDDYGVAGATGDAGVPGPAGKLKEKHDYDTINDHTRDTNLVMAMPDWMPGNLERFGSTGFFKMPLPLGYNAFWAIGQALGDAFASQTMGAHTGGFLNGSFRLIEALSNAANPFGGANIKTMAVPTLVKPLFEIFLNENFMGKKIHYADNPWEAASPAYERDPKMTKEHWSDISKMFNKLWGGDDATQGTLHGMMGGNVNMTTAKNTLRMEIGGAHMQHFLYSYLGGMGQIADSIFGAGYQTLKGQARTPGWNDIPLVSRFVSGSTFGSSTRSDQKAVRQLVENAKSGLKDAESDGGPAVAAKYKKDNKHILALLPASKKVDSQKSSFRRQRQKSERAFKAGDITFDRFRQTVEEIEEKELMLYTSFVIKARKLGISV